MVRNVATLSEKVDMLMQQLGKSTTGSLRIWQAQAGPSNKTSGESDAEAAAPPAFVGGGGGGVHPGRDILPNTRSAASPVTPQEHAALGTSRCGARGEAVNAKRSRDGGSEPDSEPDSEPPSDVDWSSRLSASAKAGNTTACGAEIEGAQSKDSGLHLQKESEASQAKICRDAVETDELIGCKLGVHVIKAEHLPKMDVIGLSFISL